jgi:hypothetical protein
VRSCCIQAGIGIFTIADLGEMHVCLGPETTYKYDPGIGSLFEQNTAMWILVAGHNP